MLVEDTSGYNDTVTRAFRKLSMSSYSDQISFGYLDMAKQGEFVTVFGSLPSHLRSCEDGSTARPVSKERERERERKERERERERGRERQGEI